MLPQGKQQVCSNNLRSPRRQTVKTQDADKDRKFVRPSSYSPALSSLEGSKDTSSNLSTLQVVLENLAILTHEEEAYSAIETLVCGFTLFKFKKILRKTTARDTLNALRNV